MKLKLTPAQAEILYKILELSAIGDDAIDEVNDGLDSPEMHELFAQLDEKMADRGILRGTYGDDE